MKKVKINKGILSMLFSSTIFLRGWKIVSQPLIKSYTDPYHKKLQKTGFVERSVVINPSVLHYSEGPDNGPALVLLHAQMMDWFDYSRVLPELAKAYHIFVIDYPGHGLTQSPLASMNANSIGEMLASFIEKVIKKPVFVSGNSSGGLLTAWLAANRPKLVKAIVLEDPPLFASEYPRIQQTIAYKSFEICDRYIQAQNTQPFLNYWIQHSSDFINKYAGKNATSLLLSMIETYQKAHPKKAIEIRFLPPIVRMLFRGMTYYDPNFGAAFYNGKWNKDFDHSETLKNIQCPTLLMHASFEIKEDGLLDGAMNQEDANKAMTLLKHGTYKKIDAMHVVHLDQPDQFIAIMNEFFLANNM